MVDFSKHLKGANAMDNQSNQGNLWSRYTEDDARGKTESAADHVKEDFLLYDFEFKHSDKYGDFIVLHTLDTRGEVMHLRTTSITILNFMRQVTRDLATYPHLLPAPIQFVKDGRMIVLVQSKFDFESAGIAPDKEQQAIYLDFLPLPDKNSGKTNDDEIPF